MKPKGPARALRVIAVHVLCEGFDLGPAGPAVRAELAAKAPDAYMRETRLGSIWKRLTGEARAAIEAAWQLETEGAPLRVTRQRRRQDAPTTALDGDDRGE